MREIKLSELRRTCIACPSQWEGRTVNDEPVYIRYRWGYLSVRIGEKGGDIESAVRGETIYGKQLGGNLDGSLTEAQMLSATSIKLLEEK